MRIITGVFFFKVRMLKKRKLISTVGNTVDIHYIAASLTTIKIMLSILSIWIL